jgi:AcrR family transcriptional regulator
MTEKQEKILHSALELYAKEGYNATSTSKVAKHAGVSEGLIFRHFVNKEGLLKAILKEGEEKIKILFADIVFETDPKSVIRKTLDTMSRISQSKEDLEFWKLQYKIKWELEQYGEHKMEALQLALTSAFTKLGYEAPEMEATLLLINLDGIATRYFLMNEFNTESMIEFLKKKYTV